MRRFELPERWDHVPALRRRVQELLQAGRHRTALDDLLRHLRHDPENTDAFALALAVLTQTRTQLLASPDPVTDNQRMSALLAPITTECTACHDGWFSSHTLMRDIELTIVNPLGLQCQNCRYTLCRDCLNRRQPQSYAEPVESPVVLGGPCPSSRCGGQLTAPVLPTGRHDVTPMDPHAIEGVIVTRDGPVLPTMDRALTIVTKFLPLTSDDQPLIHLRPSTRGLMSDKATRDELARSLVDDLEREEVLAPGAWVRSQRIFVAPGAAIDTDYLITVVGREEFQPSPSASVVGAPLYTYLLQILAANRVWSTLRDSYSGDFLDGTFGVVAAPEGTLPDIAYKINKRFGHMGLKRRVLYFKGDRTKEQFATDDVHGVVIEGSDIVAPYSANSS